MGSGRTSKAAADKAIEQTLSAAAGALRDLAGRRTSESNSDTVEDSLGRKMAQLLKGLKTLRWKRFWGKKFTDLQYELEEWVQEHPNDDVDPADVFNNLL